MPLFIIWNLFRKLRYKMRPFRTRANKTHFALQNIPELRNLIYPDLSYKPAYSRRPVVVRSGPSGPTLFRIDAHRAKLCNHEGMAVFSNPLLPVKNRSLRIELDQNCSENCQR